MAGRVAVERAHADRGEPAELGARGGGAGGEPGGDRDVADGLPRDAVCGRDDMRGIADRPAAEHAQRQAITPPGSAGTSPTW